jgi:tetratricopeptide (TPR) repeat protein
MKKALPAMVLLIGNLSNGMLAAGQYSLDDRLLQAIRSGDQAGATTLLDKGANPDAGNGYGDQSLRLAIKLDKPEMVTLLLDKGANIEAKWSDNTSTSLLEVACDSYYLSLRADRRMFYAKLLLDRGANLTPAMLACADHAGPVDLVDLLMGTSKKRQLLIDAGQKAPGERLAIYTSALKVNPDDSALRVKIIQLASSLDNPPAVPEDARHLFVLATGLIKHASEPGQLDQPIGLLRKVLEVAPWWRNAYFNLSRALEMNGHYDDAIQQMNYYLATKPPEPDAVEARAHVAIIQAEKDVAASKLK